MSRIIGLGLTLLKDNQLEEESSNNEFIVKSYSFEKYKDAKNNVLAKDINLEKNKTKEKLNPKTKVESKKKELPPLPNIKKIKEETKVESKKKELPENKEKLDQNPDKRENKSFKMDKSFLKND